MHSGHAAPVRKRLTLLEDESTRSCEYVFCEDALCSVPISRCEACSFVHAPFRDISRDGHVDCPRSILPIANATVSSFSPAAAAVLPVGLALTRSVVCVEGKLPWAAVARTPILCESPGSIPVVDHDCRLMFLLSKERIALVGGVDHVNGQRTVAERAILGLAVYERASLGEAFAIMGRHRVRELVVVDDGGVVVGKLGDVEALHFVAHVARTGSRPPPHCAD